MKKPSIGTVFNVLSIGSMALGVVLNVLGRKVNDQNLANAVEEAVSKRLGEGNN